MKPGREAEFLTLRAPVLDAMCNEATLRNAIVHSSPEDATRFLLDETWTDHQNLVEVQMRRPDRDAHGAQLLAAPISGRTPQFAVHEPAPRRGLRLVPGPS